jgi:ORF6N domain
MGDMLKIENLKGMIIEIRGCNVLLDSDVAQIYGVETKRINEAVKNNPDKFPGGYLIDLDKGEWEELKSKFSTSIKGGKVKLPTAFTEKGLYMLATILKSPVATQATLSIIETFTNIRELSRSVKELSITQDKAQQKALMQRSGELITGILDDDLQTSDAETSIELNFAVLKFKHTVKKSRKK